MNDKDTLFILEAKGIGGSIVEKKKTRRYFFRKHIQIDNGYSIYPSLGGIGETDKEFYEVFVGEDFIKEFESFTEALDAITSEGFDELPSDSSKKRPY